MFDATLVCTMYLYINRYSSLQVWLYIAKPRQRKITRSVWIPFFTFISILMYIYLESPGLRSLKEREQDWNPEAHAPSDITIPLLGRTPWDLPNMNSSRQIGCGRIIHVAHHGTIIKHLERDSSVGLVGAINCHCTANGIDKGDVRNRQGVEIMSRGTCNQELRWEEEERATNLESTEHRYN
ncbi:hypothetical protein EDB19DRAFT_1005271 [Suillus lakei]|nr:hypothetical protein EDB19DRAFT_1005271 [Suillus lakei]